MFSIRKQKILVYWIMGISFLLISLIVLLVGIHTYQRRHSRKCNTKVKDADKLERFMHSIKKDYYEIYPEYMYKDPDVNFKIDIDRYRVYDSNPSFIKKRTDKIKRIQSRLNELKLDSTKLKPREKKGLAQLEHFIGSNFGHPYDENYYAGDWMMGPNYFCKQPICSIGYSIKGVFNMNGFVPSSIQDIRKIINILRKVRPSIKQYQTNLELGVKTGMVGSKEMCLSGLNKFKTRYPKIAHYGKQGILQESFTSVLRSDKYYKKITSTMKSEFFEEYNKTVTEKMTEILILDIGRPIHELIEFLSANHSRYCVPSEVSSGLAYLPLDHIWLDGKQSNMKTTKSLPTGELLNGTKSYEMILPYFTTSSKYTYDEIYKLGLRQRDFYYNRVKKIAKIITNLSNENDAIKKFSQYLNSDEMFFNSSVIPKNESGQEGGRNCPNMEMAQKNCPIRYAAMQDWFLRVKETLSLIEPKIYKLFYTGGNKATTPACPIQMKAKFNPSSSSQSYSRSGISCLRASRYMLPFFLDRPGPKYYLYTVAGHEGRPGHHTQVQGFSEHFSSSTSMDIYDWLNINSKYTAFTEGWALYAENPLLSENTDLYLNEPLQEYGMLKGQLWRALRLIIDTGLHSRGLTFNEAKEMFKTYAWDTTDKVDKETVRYMSGPGQATAYMIGQLSIWSMRNKTIEEFEKANIDFDDKEFHFHILSQGSSPLQYLESYIDNFISCKINFESRSDCMTILYPMTTVVTKSNSIGTKKRWEIIQDHFNNEEHLE